MKKVLLFSAAMMSMSLTATAQEAVKANFSNARSMMKEAKVASVASIACDSKYDAAANKAGRRTIANGVSYGRPEGTYYMGGTYTSGEKIQFLYVPAFVDATYKNYATDKANATWQYGLAPDMYPLQGDENNDLTVSWPMLLRNYGYPQFVPTLSVGETSYQYGEELGLTGNYLINGDSILSVTQVNRAGGAYYGFSDAAIFGTFDRNIRMSDGQVVVCKQSAIYEFFSKPIAPFCLNKIEFPIVSSTYNKSKYADVTDMIPDGTTMNLYIVKMTEDGSLDEVTAVLPFTNEDIEDFENDGEGALFGYVALSKKTTDDFGTEIEEPIIIDYPYAIVIDGFAQPGVDFSLYMCNVMATERDFFEVEGGIQPTVAELVRTDNGETLNGLYYIQTFPSSDGPEYVRQYNAIIYLTGMFDVAQLVDEDFENMTAPVEGGSIYAELEDDLYSLQYYTTCPRLSDWEGIEGEENYWFVDMPDWLTVKEYYDDLYEEYNVTIVDIEAAPLPAGVNGRTAQIRLVSDKGADSGIITITQGNATGINNVQVQKETTSSSTYNLAGQHVDNNFKGLVIKNGKKFIMK